MVLFFENIHYELLLRHPALLKGKTGEFLFIGSDSILNRKYGEGFDGGIAVQFPFREHVGEQICQRKYHFKYMYIKMYLVHNYNIANCYIYML